MIIGAAQELGLRDKNGAPIASYDDPTYAVTPNGTLLTNRLAHIFDSVDVTDAKNEPHVQEMDRMLKTPNTTDDLKRG